MLWMMGIQAVRYRVYAYGSSGQFLGEINEDNDFHLQWTVDVANTKAASTIFRYDTLSEYCAHSVRLRFLQGTV